MSIKSGIGADEMYFWTKEEFMRFADCVMDKQQSYVAFMTLYWTGVRIGELLALTPNDVDINAKTISITKSYQRIHGNDVITEPKTPKSKRMINIPAFLAEDLRDYMDSIYCMDKTDRLFQITKHYLEHEIQRGIQSSGLHRIRIHDLRHSHASLLIEMGFAPLAIAERLGHERIETTMNTYAHLYPNKQIKIAMQLDSEYQEAIK